MVRVGAMAKEGKFRVKKFNGQNYQLWKMQMEDYLYQKYLYLSLGEKTKQPTNMKDEEWEVLDRKTGKNMVVPSFVSGFQYLKRKDNSGCDDHIG